MRCRVMHLRRESAQEQQQEQTSAAAIAVTELHRQQLCSKRGRGKDAFCGKHSRNIEFIVNVNVNKQYLSTRKSCNKGYDGCAMRVAQTIN